MKEKIFTLFIISVFLLTGTVGISVFGSTVSVEKKGNIVILDGKTDLEVYSPNYKIISANQRLIQVQTSAFFRNDVIPPQGIKNSFAIAFFFYDTSYPNGYNPDDPIDIVRNLYFNKNSKVEQVDAVSKIFYLPKEYSSVVAYVDWYNNIDEENEDNNDAPSEIIESIQKISFPRFFSFLSNFLEKIDKYK